MVLARFANVCRRISRKERGFAVNVVDAWFRFGAWPASELL
jgi:hypothetical protein